MYQPVPEGVAEALEALSKAAGKKRGNGREENGKRDPSTGSGNELSKRRRLSFL